MKFAMSIFSCAPGLWPEAQIYISLRHWVTQLLTDSVTDWLSDSVRKLKISVNIDARNLKFGKEHPWAHWVRFRNDQLEGPYEDHDLVIKGPYFGHFYASGLQDTPSNLKFGMEHPWVYWLRLKEHIWRTIWGQCLGHKRATLWPFLGEGATGFTRQSEIWHRASLGTLITLGNRQNGVWDISTDSGRFLVTYAQMNGLFSQSGQDFSQLCLKFGIFKVLPLVEVKFFS